MNKKDIKRDRFQRLAERRVSKCIQSMRLVGNLGNKSVYEYTDSEQKQLIAVLEAELRSLKSKFRSRQTPNDENEFKFY